MSASVEESTLQARNSERKKRKKLRWPGQMISVVRIRRPYSYRTQSLGSGVFFTWSTWIGATRFAIWLHVEECKKNFNQFSQKKKPYTKLDNSLRILSRRSGLRLLPGSCQCSRWGYPHTGQMDPAQAEPTKPWVKLSIRWMYSQLQSTNACTPWYTRD